MKYLLILVLFIASCISNNKHKSLMKDYQVSLYMDTVWIYDGDRLVDSFIHTDSSWNNQYDSIFMKDNL